MKWPWQRNQPEDYTSLHLAEQYENASGEKVQARALPVVQACLSLWERGISGIRITPDNMRLADLPPYLPMIGRSLADKGEAAFLIEPMGSRVRLVPASTVSVIGPDDPEKWMYLVSTAAPSGTTTRRVLGERVLHFRVGATVQEPWRGRSPLTEKVTDLAVAHETTLRKESRLPPGKVFKLGSLVTPEQGREFMDRIRNGGLAAIGFDASNIGGLVGVEGYGPTFTAPAVDLRDQLANSILAAFGVPPALLDVRPSGNSAREAARRFYSGTILPIAEIMQQEIRLKLDIDVTLGVPVADVIDEDVRSRAVARRAEAAIKLKELGLDNAEAMRRAGLEAEV